MDKQRPCAYQGRDLGGNVRPEQGIFAGKIDFKGDYICNGNGAGTALIGKYAALSNSQVIAKGLFLEFMQQ